MSTSGISKKIYHVFLNALAKRAGVKGAKILDARIRFGRRLDLNNPKTLADKVSWIELNTDQKLAAQCTDKYAVRDYVAKRGLESILIPLCGGPWTDVSQIDVSKLPKRFVLKATHGCDMNYICKDKSQINCEKMLASAEKWLKMDYPRACVEPHYKLIPHRLYAEEFVGGLDDTVDYKFHCINGIPQFVLTCSNRERQLKLNLYDLKWHPISGLQGPMKNEKEIAKPHKLSKMIEISRKLADGFDFVRVDLYEREDKVYFGELTFSPAAGVFPYYTSEFVSDWGDSLHVQGIC